MDMLERFAGEARKLARAKTPVFPPALLSLLGITVEAGVTVLKTLGFKARLTDAGLVFSLRRRTPPHLKAQSRAAPSAMSDSPFAKLKVLIPS